VASPHFQHMYGWAPRSGATMIGAQQGCTRVSLTRFFPPRTRFPPLRGAVPALYSHQTFRSRGQPPIQRPAPPRHILLLPGGPLISRVRNFTSTMVCRRHRARQWISVRRALCGANPGILRVDRTGENNLQATTENTLTTCGFVWDSRASLPNCRLAAPECGFCRHVKEATRAATQRTCNRSIAVGLR
jgi:hypothetical protein